jgi:hypothetical protein
MLLHGCLGGEEPAKRRHAQRGVRVGVPGRVRALPVPRGLVRGCLLE